jgi:hypothetical protein
MIKFTPFADVKKMIQNESDVLFVVGHGVSYIYPTRTSLECISNLTKNDKFKKCKVFLIDEEVQRTMEFVVGTPFMILYYNKKPVQLRFTTGIPLSPTSSTNVFNGQLTREKVEFIVNACFSKIRNLRKDVDVIVDLNMELMNVKQVETSQDAYDLTDSEDDTSSGEAGDSSGEEEQDEEKETKMTMVGSFIMKRKEN